MSARKIFPIRMSRAERALLRKLAHAMKQSMAGAMRTLIAKASV